MSWNLGGNIIGGLGGRCLQFSVRRPARGRPSRSLCPSFKVSLWGSGGGEWGFVVPRAPFPERGYRIRIAQEHPIPLSGGGDPPFPTGGGLPRREGGGDPSPRGGGLNRQL